MEINIPMRAEARGKKKAGGKKGGNKRSQMLRMIMPLMSHTNGEQLADAIDGNNIHKMREVMTRIMGEVSKKLEQRARKGGVAQ